MDKKMLILGAAAVGIGVFLFKGKDTSDEGGFGGSGSGSEEEEKPLDVIGDIISGLTPDIKLPDPDWGDEPTWSPERDDGFKWEPDYGQNEKLYTDSTVKKKSPYKETPKVTQNTFGEDTWTSKLFDLTAGMSAVGQTQHQRTISDWKTDPVRKLAGTVNPYTYIKDAAVNTKGLYDYFKKSDNTYKHNEKLYTTSTVKPTYKHDEKLYTTSTVKPRSQPISYITVNRTNRPKVKKPSWAK